MSSPFAAPALLVTIGATATALSVVTPAQSRLRFSVISRRRRRNRHLSPTIKPLCAYGASIGSACFWQVTQARSRKPWWRNAWNSGSVQRLPCFWQVTSRSMLFASSSSNDCECANTLAHKNPLVTTTTGTRHRTCSGVQSVIHLMDWPVD